MEEENRNIVLQDETGKNIDFTVVDVYELNGKTYFAMVEAAEIETTDEVLIMYVEGKDEEMKLEYIEDEKELNEAFDEFVRRDEDGCDCGCEDGCDCGCDDCK